MTLVEDARLWWRWWSVRMAMVAGAAAGAVVAQPQILTNLVAYVPERWRPLAGSLVGIITFAAPTLARILKQRGKSNGNAA
ncbi:hypothetical protein [Novosphingobium humi]|uniref:Holin n=1 Tax=Novosphingobium humi TaxID=2282397 RepID=A0ABY7U297_9SPHN|nr:hypothetical protein [Novosphingobium humi]WCT78866.1 hypothetical protein PQ457_07890 [Novosphingobium humi]